MKSPSPTRATVRRSTGGPLSRTAPRSQNVSLIYCGISTGAVGDIRLRVVWNAVQSISIPIPRRGIFPHPRTGERVEEASSGWADTEPWLAEFSPEGIKLADPRVGKSLSTSES